MALTHEGLHGQQGSSQSNFSQLTRSKLEILGPKPVKLLMVPAGGKLVRPVGAETQGTEPTHTLCYSVDIMYL